MPGREPDHPAREPHERPAVEVSRPVDRLASPRIALDARIDRSEAPHVRRRAPRAGGGAPEEGRLAAAQSEEMPKALIPLIAVTFVDVLGFTILIPLLPYYAQRYGATPSTIAAIYATVAACALVAAPLWGRLSDRVGRKAVLTAAQVAAFLGFAVLAWGDALWTIFLARAIEGLGGGGLGVTQAYVTDVTTPQERPRAFALLGATYGLGFLVGPVMAGALVGFGYRVPFVVAAALALVTIVMTQTLLPDARGGVPQAPGLAQIRAALGARRLGRLLLTQFGFSMAFTAWVTVFALFAQAVLRYGPRESASIFVVSSIVSIAVQIGAVGRLVDRFGEGRIALLALGVSALAYASVYFVRDVPAFYAAIVLWSLGSALIRPTLGALVSKAAPAEQRGTILGVSDGLNNLAFLLAPFISTAVFRVDPRLTGLVPLAFTALAAVIGATTFLEADDVAAGLVA